MYFFATLLLFSLLFIAHGFVPTRGVVRHAASLLKMSDGGLDDTTKKFLDETVKSNKVLLFMKGNKIFPQCGFSNTACRILDAIGQPFETVNVLDSDKIRNGIKVYSSWPTIPQLYVDGEFVGGCDVMIEMYENGELAEMIEVATAS